MNQLNLQKPLKLCNTQKTTLIDNINMKIDKISLLKINGPTAPNYITNLHSSLPDNHHDSATMTRTKHQLIRSDPA